MYPTSSAQAAEAVSKHPPSTISNRLRSIASPGGPKTHRALNTLIGPANAFVKGYERSRFTNSNSQLAPVQSAELSCLWTTWLLCSVAPLILVIGGAGEN